MGPGRVVVVGSINLDHSLRVARHPRPGETVSGSDLQSASGGKGANQAVAAARLGSGVRLLGAVGADIAGGAALASLTAAGVDVSGVQSVAGQATGQAFICVSAEGENTIVVAAGANAALRPDRLALAGAGVVLCQLETPRDTVAAALEGARAVGAVAMLNAAPCEPWARDLVPLCDMLIVNETELAELGGGEGADPAAAARRLGMRADQSLVVTLGANGAAAFSGGAVVHVPGRPARVVDSTGAGDCFCGVLAALLAEARELPEALALANIAASLSVEHAGAQAGMPTRTAIEAAAQISSVDWRNARGLTA